MVHKQDQFTTAANPTTTTTITTNYGCPME